MSRVHFHSVQHNKGCPMTYALNTEFFLAINQPGDKACCQVFLDGITPKHYTHNKGIPPTIVGVVKDDNLVCFIRDTECCMTTYEVKISFPDANTITIEPNRPRESLYDVWLYWSLPQDDGNGSPQRTTPKDSAP